MTESYPIDHYFTIQADEMTEGHILCTPAQGEALQAELRRRFTEAGYDYTYIGVEPGGDYDLILERGDDINATATEIIDVGGFVLDD